MDIELSMVTYAMPILLKGMANTILFCSVSMVIGFVLAVGIALGRFSRHAVLRRSAQWFVELIRNTPFLVQAFLVFFALPKLGVRFNATTAGILVLSLYAAAYFTESIRGAILSVPKGQMEAARAVGMPYFRAMRRIVFPQMLGYLLPSLTNQVIGVIKESAALSVISVPEAAMAAQVVLGVSFNPVDTYIMVALLYWLVTATIAAVMLRVERRVLTRRPGKSAAPVGASAA
jgi:polar amino acid transport system permease protein